MKRESIKGSLNRKSVIMMVISAIILSAATILVSTRVVSNIIDDHYRKNAENMSKTLAVTIDAEAASRVCEQVKEIYSSAENRVGSEEWGSDAFNDYVALFSDVEKSEDFIALREELAAVQDVNDVDCVYLTFVDPEAETMVYIVDADHAEPCPPGCYDPIYEMNRKVLTDPDVGFPAYVTNTEEYGWLVTAGVPVYTKEGKLACYAFTDISMNVIMEYRRRMLLLLILLEAALTVLIAFFGIRAINRAIVKPVNQLSEAAANYSKEGNNYHSSFASVDIRSGDEIEALSESMKKMERDINDNIANILALTDKLDESRTEAVLLNELAKKDALTGVRNKLAYDEEMGVLEKSIKKGETEFGMAVFDLDDLKKVNDTYGHEKGDIAIRKLSEIICRVFAHSPVFRIGGDEFVVILRGGDYDNADKLVKECRGIFADLRKDKKLDPWERVSASVGYALFDERKEASAADVFRHADNDMYNRKKASKAGR